MRVDRRLRLAASDGSGSPAGCESSTPTAHDRHAKRRPTSPSAPLKEQVKLHCGASCDHDGARVRGYFDDEGSEIALIKGTGETGTSCPRRGTARAGPPCATPPRRGLRPGAPRCHATRRGPLHGTARAPMNGIRRCRCSGHDAPAAAGIVKPMDKPLIKPEDKAAARPRRRRRRPRKSLPRRPTTSTASSLADKAAAKPADDKHAKPADKAAEVPSAAAKTGHGAEAPQASGARGDQPHERGSQRSRAPRKRSVRRPCGDGRRGTQVAALSPCAARPRCFPTRCRGRCRFSPRPRGAPGVTKASSPSTAGAT